MDHIIQALERAQATPAVKLVPRTPRTEAPNEPVVTASATRDEKVIEVRSEHLERMRIVAHEPALPGAKAFDLLRTQVLQAMEKHEWRILAVTSPTPACGKTFTALNLALSMARQPESSVLLVDLDLQKPQVSQRLGLTPATGLRALLDGQASLHEAVSHVSAGNLKFRVLPCERPSSRASDWTGSRQMAAVFQELRAQRDLKTVVLDLPPILAGDQALSILPHVDCVLMVAAAGMTKATELKECADYLKTTPLVQITLNKAPVVRPLYY
jgi:Mrp family chromosome partitioning ATPase